MSVAKRKTAAERREQKERLEQLEAMRERADTIEVHSRKAGLTTVRTLDDEIVHGKGFWIGCPDGSRVMMQWDPLLKGLRITGECDKLGRVASGITIDPLVSNSILVRVK